MKNLNLAANHIVLLEISMGPALSNDNNNAMRALIGLLLLLCLDALNMTNKVFTKTLSS